MKAFSLIKTFTLVVFLLVGHAGFAADDDGDLSSKYKTKEQCIKAECGETQIKAWEVACPKPETKDGMTRGDADYAEGCFNKKKNACESKCADLPTTTESRASCKEATTAFNTANKESGAACSAFDSTSPDEKTAGAKCASNIANCKAKLKGLFNGSGTDFVGGSSNGDLSSILGQLGQSKLGISGDQTQGPTCVKDPDLKERKSDAQKNAEKISKLKEDIRKEADKQAELLEKQRDKLDEIKKKTNEAEADYKKELLKKDAKERDQTNEINKSTIDTAKKLRAFGTAITAEQQKLAKERLNYQKAMLDLTSEKITAKCKQEFESLKAGIVNAKINDPANSSAEQKQLEALAKMYKGKISGTASLASLLNLTKKACFEKADSQVADTKLASDQNIQTINGKIDELNAQIADEKKTAENNKAAIEAVKKGMTDEKAAEEKEKIDKLTALNDEVMNFGTSTNEKIQISRQRANDLNTEIMDVTLRKNFDSTAAFTSAETSINTAEAARQDVIVACNCVEGKPKDPLNKKNGCLRFVKDKVDIEAAEKKLEKTRR